MGTKSAITAAKDVAENIQNVQESQGFSEIERLAETVGLKQQTDKALEMKDAASESFTDKKEILEATRDDAETKPWWKKGMKWVIGGGFGLLLGNEIFGGKEKTEEVTENVVETTEEVINIATNEKQLAEANDTFKSAIEAEQSLTEANDKIADEWGFEKGKRSDDLFEEIKNKEDKYNEDYGHVSVWKEAWEKTKFKIDKETGEKTTRNFLGRLISLVPALTITYASWRGFEAAKESGIIDKAKEGKRYKEEADKKIEEANEKFEEGLETKREAFGAVFEENPGAIQVSKDYLKKLANLTRNADKFSSPERAAQMRKIAREAVEEGAKKVGPGFSKMKGFEKYMPGISVKARGGLMVVEIIGKSLGQALREGAEGGGLSKALGVFWEELGDTETWKDAAPIWGTIRSAKRLTVENDIPRWSKWLDFGLSAGMDVAMGVGIVASFGTLSAPLLAARAAAGAAVKGGIRKVTLKQMAKQFAKKAGQTASKGVSKKSRRSVAMAAGGKWGIRINLMMATVGEFFGEDMEAIQTEVKHEAYNTLLTPEQKYFIALEKAAKNGEIPPEREAIFAEEDKKQKKEIEHDKKKQEAGVLAASSTEDEEEKESFVLHSKEASQEEKSQTLFEKAKKIVKEEIISKTKN